MGHAQQHSWLTTVYQSAYITLVSAKQSALSGSKEYKCSRQNRCEWTSYSSSASTAAAGGASPLPCASAAACHRQFAPPARGGEATAWLGGLPVLLVLVTAGLLRMFVRPKWLLSHMDEPL